MAEVKKAKSNGAAPSNGVRDYVVVKVTGTGTGTTLTVLETVKARRQEEAMDAVAAKLAPEQRNGTLGAFVANSWRDQDIKTEQAWKTTKSAARKAAFAAKS